MNINAFMGQGIDRILKTAGRFYLSHAKGRRFMAGMLPRLRAAARRREDGEAAGTHVPAFLIASIASRCNLRCAGCYSREGGGCSDAGGRELDAGQWRDVFREAAGLGVSFVLLAGGEPLMRPDVIGAAAECDELFFPVFTNGTLLDDRYLELFDDNRHLIPILSVEGDAARTDARRGGGTYERLRRAMTRLAERRILYGVSVTVTTANMGAVLSPEFTDELRAGGCGAVVYVEYVPVQADTAGLALSDGDVRRMNREAAAQKRRYTDMIVLSFPGDEEAMGGCLASGRGFFHINAAGGAEPCPFSPYAQHNVTETPMRQVLASRYFEELRDMAAQAGPHTGGCVLFQREEAVRQLLARG